MAELATIARPYAEALFEAARSQSLALDAVANQLDALALVSGDAQIRQLAGDPQLALEGFAELLLSTLKQPALPAIRNLLQVVLDNHRLAAVSAIALQFHQLKDAAEACAEAVITSAYALGDAQVQQLLPALERKFGCKLYPRVELDPSLIGGVRVTVGDEVLDTSVRARLESMRVTLTA